MTERAIDWPVRLPERRPIVVSRAALQGRADGGDRFHAPAGAGVSSRCGRVENGARTTVRGLLERGGAHDLSPCECVVDALLADLAANGFGPEGIAQTVDRDAEWVRERLADVGVDPDAPAPVLAADGGPSGGDD